MASSNEIDVSRHRYPCCVVWTPIPVLTWLFPIIGHMGICTTGGLIRDFAGSYFVSEDEMAFGWPARYVQFDLKKCAGGVMVWDRAVAEASDEYSHRAHNLCCDNCHSHVALALKKMNYNNRASYWNMVTLTALIFFSGKYVSFCGFVKHWLPFVILWSSIIAVAVAFSR